MPGPLYEFDGCRLTSADSVFVEVLGRAHDSRRRLRCLCQQSGVAMYVARNGDRLIVKRMPGTGPDHHPQCRSSGVYLRTPAPLTQSQPVAVETRTGVTHLRLAFDLRRAARGAAMNSTKVSGQNTGGNHSLSLLGLLQLLWDAAGLNEWRPQFAGKRNWAVVRSRLLHAAAGMETGEGPLLNQLFIPEVFSTARRNAIRARRHDAWGSTAAPLGGDHRLLMMIAEVKDVRRSQTGGFVVMKHLPDCTFMLGPAYFSALQARWESIPPWPSQDHRRLVVIGTFAPALKSNLSIFLIAHQPVFADWVAH